MFQENIRRIKEEFLPTLTAEERYNLLIQLGRRSPPLPSAHKTAENLVPGCQSVMHLHTETKGGKLFFTTSSDALISAGLGYLLCLAYSGLSPEEILTSPPKFLEEIGLAASLTPSRVNGLYQIHLKIQQKAVAALT